MRESLAVAVVVFVVYAGAALGVTNGFPFSTFPMYSDAAPTSGARLVVKDMAGAYSEVARWTNWRCETELDYAHVELTMCPDGEIGQPTSYLAKDALDHIRAHAGEDPAAESIELIVKVWRLAQQGSPTLDCTITRCQAVRR